MNCGSPVSSGVHRMRRSPRMPQGTFLVLGPHIDAGSLCRWADPKYRKAYADIFSESPENHDAFNVRLRRNANQTAFPRIAHSTVMRAFQGWTALSKTAPREGTILLYPNLNAAISYVLLRPFFKPPDDASQLIDASKRTFDPAESWFPDCLLHMPLLIQGDTVWWHTDACYAVDAEYLGDQYATVAYIAAMPTSNNKDYMRRQYNSMAASQPPEAFLGSGVDESKLVGFQKFADKEDVFRKLMGY